MKRLNTLAHTGSEARGPGRAGIARFAAILMIIPIVAACASKSTDDPATVPGLQVASRVIGNEGAYIEVDAVHRSFNDRIERITLVGPNGKEIAADQVRTDTIRNRGRYAGAPVGSIGVGVGGYGGGGVGVGFGLGFPLVLGSRRYANSVFRTRATIKVPDPKEYVADPKFWKVRVHMRNRKRGEFYRDYPAPVPETG